MQSNTIRTGPNSHRHHGIFVPDNAANNALHHALKKFATMQLVLTSSFALLLFGSSCSRQPSQSGPPIITQISIPASALVGEKIMMEAAAKDCDGRPLTAVHWNVALNGATVGAGSNLTAHYTFKERGSFVVTVTATDASGRSTVVTRNLLAETGAERDARLFKAIVGKWRAQEGDTIGIFDYRQSGELVMRLELATGQRVDVAMAAMQSAGGFTATWWVQDGRLCQRMTGHEDGVLNALAHVSAAVTGKSFNKVESGEIISVDNMELVISQEVNGKAEIGRMRRIE